MKISTNLMFQRALDQMGESQNKLSKLQAELSSGKSVAEQNSKGFEICLSRKPDAEELNRLVALFEQIKEEYSQDQNLAKQMATDPIGPVPSGMNTTDLAALTVTSNVLLNLDEILMKR